MTTLALKEKILDFYYNLYLCLVFLRSCVVALLPLPKKNIGKDLFSQSSEKMNQ